MNKEQLIIATAEKNELSKAKATEVVNSVFETIMDAVAEGDKVTISGFGNFEARERAARTGRNPQTGEPMEIKASKTPGFKPLKAFKDKLK